MSNRKWRSDGVKSLHHYNLENNIFQVKKEALVREAFKDTIINVTVEGQKHLGAVIGSRDYLQDYVNEKVTSWVNEVAQLAEFARAQPQASYAAHTFGLNHRWAYFLRNLPDIQDLLEPLEEAISQVLIPAIVERKCSKLETTSAHGRPWLEQPMSRGGTQTSLVYSGDIPSRRTYRGSNSSTTRRVPHQVWASGCQTWKNWRTFRDCREPKTNCSTEDQASPRISARKRLLCMAHSSSPSRTGFQPQ